MQPPTVSVILPTYNRASTLRRAITSVLSQDTTAPLELIVVDDNSTDGTADVVAAIQDERLHYIRRTTNGGASAARNAGIMAARGRYIAFIDSDDEWLPFKLEKQLAALDAAGTDIGMVVCGLIRWDKRQAVYLPPPDRRRQRERNLKREIIRQNFALTSCWLVRREFFDRVGPFDEQLKCLVDWEWLLRFCLRYDLCLIEEPLLMVYASPDSISSRELDYIESLEKMLYKHASALVHDRRSLSNLHYVLGKKYCLYRSMREGRLHLLQAIRLYPLDLRVIAALLLSLLGMRLFTLVWRSVRHSKGFVA
ncbi:MAG TPA: glycosyltransferase family 2 protein [Nevskiales bacterium]|nr:glycosyltransferase family 2 protein [Nevskiales bacterium]